MAEAAGYPYYVTGLNVKLNKGMYGNTTLSKFPITQSRNIDLTVGKRKARGCQYSSIQLSATPLIFPRILKFSTCTLDSLPRKEFDR